MKSATMPSFWETYERLDKNTRERARKAFMLWAENPFYPSLRFKCINPQENTWSVRVTRGIRAVGKLKGDTVPGSGLEIMMTMNSSLGKELPCLTAGF